MNNLEKLHDFFNLRNFGIKEEEIVSNKTNLKELLQHVWELKEFQRTIKMDHLVPVKDDKSSNKKRELGNMHFRNGVFDEALSNYNDCIINAVQPGAAKFMESSTALCFGFGNRSAVLFEMQQYDLCLADIRRAFDHNYPAKLHQKLIIREMKCHFAKNNLPDAKNAYNKYKIDENYKYDAQLFKTLNKLMSDFKKEFKMKKKEIVEDIPCFNVPKNMKTSSKFLCASDALEFNISSDKGRGFIAKRDIMPGEVLMKEKAFSSCLTRDSLHTHCSYCLRKINFAPIPCTSCTNVIFCDEYCRTNADKLFHATECSMISKVSKLNHDSCYVRLLIRMVCQTGSNHLLEQYKLYEKECQAMTQNEVGFNSDGVYQSEDLRTVFHLATNKHLRKKEELNRLCRQSLMVFKLISDGGPLADIPGKVNLYSLSEEQLTLSAALLSLLMVLVCNSHGLQHTMDPHDVESPLEMYGGGIFPTFSLLNHSCDPNMELSTIGFAQMGIAVQVIKAGSEIDSNYGPWYAAMDKFMRKSALKRDFQFNCNCKACGEDWPTLLELPDVLKCNKCKNDIKYSRCRKCKTSYINYLALARKSDPVIKKYDSKSPTKDDVNFAKELIIFFNKNCVSPTERLIAAQDKLNLIAKYCAHLNLSEFFPKHEI